MWVYCFVCSKIAAWNHDNIVKLRWIIVSTCCTGGVVGAFALPFLGFGSSGIVAGSLAAALQASIGNVAAGSAFAILQSLGATGLGTILFGSLGAATPLLIGIAVKYLNWCNDNDHKIISEKEN